MAVLTPPGSGLRRLRGGLALLLVGAAGWVGAAPPPGSAPLEQRVKSAFLFNFAKFVDWPAAALEDRPTLRSCVLGEPALVEALERTVAGKRVRGKGLSVMPLEDLRHVQRCHILYVAPRHMSRLPQILAAIDERPVLTVGDAASFASRGGMIGLRREDNKVRFDVNLGVAERSGLRISSKLLGLAGEVLVATEEVGP